MSENKAYPDGAGQSHKVIAPSFGAAVGCAAIILDWDKDDAVLDARVATSSVDGAQTVPRAETQATLLAVELAKDVNQ